MSKVKRTPAEVLAIPNNEIDRELEAGLRCPHCGGQEFNTLQECLVAMPINKGKWGDMEDAEDGDTVEVSCDGCEDEVIWVKHERGE